MKLMVTSEFTSTRICVIYWQICLGQIMHDYFLNMIKIKSTFGAF